VRTAIHRSLLRRYPALGAPLVAGHKKKKKMGTHNTSRPKSRLPTHIVASSHAGHEDLSRLGYQTICE